MAPEIRSKSFGTFEKQAPGFKKAKDRLTVLGCTNATGTHKLKHVLTGKSTKPRCFKNVNIVMDALPVIYKSQRNAWMNSEIFAEWFSKEFVPAVKRHQRLQNIRSPKALLLIDNCSAHPDELSSRDGSVTCMFLPPNTTSLIQPMDQGVLQAMKKKDDTRESSSRKVFVPKTSIKHRALRTL